MAPERPAALPRLELRTASGTWPTVTATASSVWFCEGLQCGCVAWRESGGRQHLAYPGKFTPPHKRARAGRTGLAGVAEPFGVVDALAGRRLDGSACVAQPSFLAKRARTGATVCASLRANGVASREKEPRQQQEQLPRAQAAWRTPRISDGSGGGKERAPHARRQEAGDRLQHWEPHLELAMKADVIQPSPSSRRERISGRLCVCTKPCWAKGRSLFIIPPPHHHHHHRHSLGEHQQGGAPPTVRGRPTKSLAVGADRTCSSIGRSWVIEAAGGPQKSRMRLGLAKQLAIRVSSEKSWSCMPSAFPYMCREIPKCVLAMLPYVGVCRDRRHAPSAQHSTADSTLDRNGQNAPPATRPPLRSRCAQGGRRSAPPEPNKLPHELLGLIAPTAAGLSSQHARALWSASAELWMACGLAPSGNGNCSTIPGICRVGRQAIAGQGGHQRRVAAQGVLASHC